MEIKKTMSIHEFDKFMNKKVQICYWTSDNESGEEKLAIGKIVKCDVGKQTIDINGSKSNSLIPFICTFIDEKNQEIHIAFKRFKEIELL